MACVYGNIKILAKQGETFISIVPIEEKQFTVGRNEDCDMRIQREDVSDTHARIEQDDQKNVWIVNLSKENTTQLNGKPLKEKSKLKNGDRFNISGRMFEWEDVSNGNENRNPNETVPKKFLGKTPVKPNIPPSSNKSLQSKTPKPTKGTQPANRMNALATPMRKTIPSIPTVQKIAPKKKDPKDAPVRVTKGKTPSSSTASKSTLKATPASRKENTTVKTSQLSSKTTPAPSRTTQLEPAELPVAISHEEENAKVPKESREEEKCHQEMRYVNAVEGDSSEESEDSASDEDICRTLPTPMKQEIARHPRSQFPVKLDTPLRMAIHSRGKRESATKEIEEEEQVVISTVETPPASRKVLPTPLREDIKKKRKSFSRVSIECRAAEGENLSVRKMATPLRRQIAESNKKLATPKTPKPQQLSAEEDTSLPTPRALFVSEVPVESLSEDEVDDHQTVGEELIEMACESSLLFPISVDGHVDEEIMCRKLASPPFSEETNSKGVSMKTPLRSSSRTPEPIQTAPKTLLEEPKTPKTSSTATSQDLTSEVQQIEEVSQDIPSTEMASSPLLTVIQTPGRKKVVAKRNIGAPLRTDFHKSDSIQQDERDEDPSENADNGEKILTFEFPEVAENDSDIEVSSLTAEVEIPEDKEKSTISYPRLDVDDIVAKFVFVEAESKLSEDSVTEDENSPTDGTAETPEEEVEEETPEGESPKEMNESFLELWESVREEKDSQGERLSKKLLRLPASKAKGSKTYYELVSFPIDLQTIKKKISREEYHSPAAYAKDMILCFDNAILFNRDQGNQEQLENSEILKKLFIGKYEKHFGRIDPSQQETPEVQKEVTKKIEEQEDDASREDTTRRKNTKTKKVIYEDQADQEETAEKSHSKTPSRRKAASSKATEETKELEEPKEPEAEEGPKGRKGRGKQTSKKVEEVEKESLQEILSRETRGKESGKASKQQTRKSKRCEEIEESPGHEEEEEVDVEEKTELKATEEFSRDDIQKMRVVDLRVELKKRNLSASGLKAELITRLTQALFPNTAEIKSTFTIL